MLRKLSEFVKHGGTPYLFIETLLNKLPFHAVRVRRFYMLQLDEVPLIEEKHIYCYVREGTHDDIDGLSKIDNKKDIFRERLISGEHLIVGIHEGKIVGYQWFSDKSYHIEGRYQYRIDIPSDTFYVYDAFTVPEYRGKGWWINSTKYLIEIMKGMKKRMLICGIDHYNIYSVKMCCRFGYRIYKDIIEISVFGMTILKELPLKHNE